MTRDLEKFFQKLKQESNKVQLNTDKVKGSPI